MTVTNDTFDQLQANMRQQGPAAALGALAKQLAAEGKFHELFDVRLMQARQRLGLPIIVTKGLDDLPEPQRSQVEAAYLDACREVGQELLKKGDVRQAWMYLRPLGDKKTVADALRQLDAEEDYDTIIELSIYEGIAPRLGFELLIERQGTCNAISTYDAEMNQRSKEDRQAVASLLVERLHNDLTHSLRTDIQRQEGSNPAEASIAELCADRDWLFANDNYHIDTSHLSSVMRFAIVVDDPAVLRKAIDLAAYGCHLSPQLQYPGDPPFEDLYPSSRLFFHALLGEQLDQALPHFEAIATREAEENNPGPAEIYVGLLSRLGRWADAIDATARLIPAGTQRSGLAPSLLEMAHFGQQYDRMQRVARERGDIVGFAAALVEQAASAKQA